MAVLKRLKAMFAPVPEAVAPVAVEAPASEAAVVVNVPADADPVLMEERGATADSPIVYVRDASGLTKCRVREARAFSFTVAGRQCAHVDEAPDGTWIYEMRTY